MTQPEPTLPGTTELQVAGMTCKNCARHVTEAIQSVPQVASVSVRLDASHATVRWQGEPNVPGVLKAVAEAGYEATPVEEHATCHESKASWSPLAGWRFNVVVGLICTLPLVIGDWAFRWGMQPWFRWLAFALALPVQIFCGAKFYVGAWRQLKAGASNMDTLVALGSTTAFGYSVWALFTGAPGHLYFMESAAIITLISLGHWFEARTSERAESALHALLHLAPAMARRRNADGSEAEVPVRELRLNDTVILKPGDHVPVDGEATEGAGAVDETMLTGESLPVEKKPGDKLYAGTVNLNGRILMRVTATGEATALAHIIAAVERAQNSRAEIQRLGDRVSSVFVPIVVLIALGTGLWWAFGGEQARQTSEWLSKFLWPVMLPASAFTAAFIQSAAVLIIACPCAMGLATPVAIMAGANAAARRGILVRDGVALERAGKITAIVFDKTGTLTQGRPEVAGQEVYTDAPDTMKLAAALARRSNHPLSQAVAKLHDEEFALENWEEVRGAGVRAIFDFRFLNADSGMGGDESKVQRPMSKVGDGVGGVERVAPSPDRGQAEAHDDCCGCGDGENVEETSSQPRFSPFPVRSSNGNETEGQRALVDLIKVGVKSGVQTPGVTLRLGSVRWLRETGVDVAQGRKFEEQWSVQGATLLGIAADKNLLGLLAVKDTLKPGADAVTRQLQQQGLQTYLVTGDNALTAQAIAKQAGIPEQNVSAEVRPEQKAQFIHDLQKQGARVAFVGDGINDAPALEAADLGIAVSRASDVARAAADMILLKSEIQAVPEALGLARATLRTIKQNLFWAFFYNACGIPLAALGFLSPLLCALAMGMSDLVVIGNALRLLRWKLKRP